MISRMPHFIVKNQNGVVHGIVRNVPSAVAAGRAYFRTRGLKPYKITVHKVTAAAAAAAEARYFS